MVCVLGAWCLVRGAWCVVHGAWCLVLGAWCVAGCTVLVVFFAVRSNSIHSAFIFCCLLPPYLSSPHSCTMRVPFPRLGCACAARTVFAAAALASASLLHHTSCCLCSILLLYYYLLPPSPGCASAHITHHHLARLLYLSSSAPPYMLGACPASVSAAATLASPSIILLLLYLSLFFCTSLHARCMSCICIYLSSSACTSLHARCMSCICICCCYSCLYPPPPSHIIHLAVYILSFCRLPSLASKKTKTPTYQCAPPPSYITHILFYFIIIILSISSVLPETDVTLASAHITHHLARLLYLPLFSSAPPYIHAPPALSIICFCTSLPTVYILSFCRSSPCLFYILLQV